MQRPHQKFSFLVVLLVSLTSTVFAAQPQANPSAQADNPETMLRRAESLTARKLYDDALEIYAQLLKMRPRDATLHNRMGVIHTHRQDLAEAKKAYQRAIKFDPKYAEAINNLGYVFYRDRSYKKAIQHYQRAIKLKPNMATFHANLAAAYFARNEYEKASEALSIAIDLDPELWERISATGTVVATTPRSYTELAKSSFHVAKVFASKGMTEHCLQHLTRAFEYGFKDVQLIYNDPAFAKVLNDEKFKQLMANPPKPIEETR